MDQRHNHIISKINNHIISQLSKKDGMKYGYKFLFLVLLNYFWPKKFTNKRDEEFYQIFNQAFKQIHDDIKEQLDSQIESNMDGVMGNTVNEVRDATCAQIWDHIR
ncbi:MAG: hypothetical protein Q8P20_09990 [bacterium]|nr:hypothetical protein [bacterium]